MDIKLYPIRFAPLYKAYPWGGTRIPKTYHRTLPPGIYAESWEISDREESMSVIANGPRAGRTLRETLQENPTAILGTHVSGTRFPLLIKLIDARERLSLQVHPDDHSAEIVGGEAKTEAWIMLGDNPSAIFCGLQDGTTERSLRHALTNETAETLVKKINLQKGDAVLVRGGTVHAIDAGSLLLEIQQNSNTTYRLHDWNRTGPDGQPRELHIEQAFKVIDWAPPNPATEPILKCSTPEYQRFELIRCEHFCIEKIKLNGEMKTSLDGTSFDTLFITKGTVTLTWNNGNETLPMGTSVLIPATLPSYTLSGQAEVIRTFIP